MRHVTGFFAAALAGMLAAYVCKPHWPQPRTEAPSRGFQEVKTPPDRTAERTPAFANRRDDPERGQDPAAAIETVLASWSHDPLQAQSDLYETLRHFTAEDFRRLTRDPHAFDVLTASLENDFRAKRAFVDGMAARWLAVDEEAAFAWLASKPKVVRWGVGTGDFAVEAFARVRPERMLAHVLSLPPSDDRRTMTAALIRTVGETDVKLAKAWIERFDDPGTRAFAERGYLEAMAKLDPFSVLRPAKSLSASDAGAAWSAAISEAVRRGGSVAKALAEKADTTEQKMWIASALRSTDPETAAELITDEAGSNPDAVLASHAASRVATDFARRDLEKARAWAEALPPGLRTDALENVMQVWAGSDPRAAMDWLAVPARDALLGEKSAADTRATIFTSWLKSHENAARAYVAELPPGQTRDAMQTALIAHICRYEKADEAVALFAKVTPPGDGKLAVNIANALLNGDRAEAAAWAASLPEGKDRTMAIGSIVDSWSRSDPVAVTNWIQQFPDGEERDQAIRACIKSVGSLDTASASEWVLQIGDPWNRAMAAKKVFDAMRWRDPVPAIQWFSQVPGIDETVRHTTLQDNR